MTPTITILGRTLVEIGHDEWASRVNDVTVWLLDTGHGHRPNFVLRIHRSHDATNDGPEGEVPLTVRGLATTDDAALAWLAAASLDAPTLCHAVLDGMCSEVAA